MLGAAESTAARPYAHVARTVHVREHASLHLKKKSGSTIEERGSATGTIPGSVSARFTLRLLFVSGTVTIHAAGGSLTMAVNGVGTSPSKFGGSMTIKHGTGRYAHAHGRGKFNGTVDRRTWRARVNATGNLRY